MADLMCEECEWFETGFDRNEEIKEYMQKTELLKPHFSDQDCPKCEAEKSTQVYYRMCTDCGEAEVDCMCEVETPDITEQEREELQKKVMDLVSKKIEETDMQKEQERLRFKEKDLRRMAQNLIQVSFGGN